MASVTNGNIVALDTPQNLKEKKQQITALWFPIFIRGKRKWIRTIEAPELKAGIPFAYDEIISIHSQGADTGRCLIQYTEGAGLNVEKPCSLFKKDCWMMHVREILSGGAGFLFYILCSSPGYEIHGRPASTMCICMILLGRRQRFPPSFGLCPLEELEYCPLPVIRTGVVLTPAARRPMSWFYAATEKRTDTEHYVLSPAFPDGNDTAKPSAKEQS